MEEKTLEASFKELDTVMEKLSGEEITLEESFLLYQKGMELLKVCNDKIDTVEKQMQVLDEEGNVHEF